MKEQYPKLNHKRALMRTYKRTISRKSDSNGENWVCACRLVTCMCVATRVMTNKPVLFLTEQLEQQEFRAFLVNLLYFNKLWKVFYDSDTNDDRQLNLSFAEFKHGLKHVALTLPDAEAQKEFDAMDSNNGGSIFFDEVIVLGGRDRV